MEMTDFEQQVREELQSMAADYQPRTVELAAPSRAKRRRLLRTPLLAAAAVGVTVLAVAIVFGLHGSGQSASHVSIPAICAKKSASSTVLVHPGLGTQSLTMNVADSELGPVMCLYSGVHPWGTALVPNSAMQAAALVTSYVGSRETSMLVAVVNDEVASARVSTAGGSNINFDSFRVVDGRKVIALVRPTGDVIGMSLFSYTGGGLGTYRIQQIEVRDSGVVLVKSSLISASTSSRSESPTTTSNR